MNNTMKTTSTKRGPMPKKIPSQTPKKRKGSIHQELHKKGSNTKGSFKILGSGPTPRKKLSQTHGKKCCKGVQFNSS